MAHLDAFALKATGTTKTLKAPSLVVGLASTTAGVGRHVGLTGANPETRTTWIHVSDVGEWEGHQNGPFALTRESFAQCVAALRACETPPPVDYDHASLRPLDGKPTPAAGYILDLALRPDGLYALVEFTEPAAKMIKAGEYRFCSGVFVWDAPDRQTGEPIPCQLDSIGLTNKPFIDGQHAIRLSRRALGASMEIKKSELMSKLDALVSGTTVTGDELKALVAFLEQSAGGEGDPPSGETEIAAEVMDAAKKPMEAACAAPPPMAPMAAPAVEVPPAEVAAAGDAAAMLITKLAELTGLDSANILASLDANSDQIKAAFLGADGAIPYSALSAKVEVADATIAQLSNELKAYRDAEAKRADDSLVAEVETLVACGKVLPAMRPHMLALGRNSPEGFKSTVAMLSQVVPMGREAPKDAPATDALGGTNVEPDKTHPRYAALHKSYSDPRSAWAQHLPKAGPEREERIHKLVLSQIRREQPVSG